jgi:hypothetical protein
MSGAFDPPSGDPAAIRQAARTLTYLANDLSTQATAAKNAVATAMQTWTAPRGEDFRRAGLAIIDELSMTASALGTGSRLLSTYAGELERTIGAVSGSKTAADQAHSDAETSSRSDPANAEHYRLTASMQQSNQLQQAINAKVDLATFAQTIARQLDAQTDLAVPGRAALSPSAIARQVDRSLGITRLAAPGMSFQDAWAIIAGAAGPAFDPNAPAPNDPAFAAWFGKLSPLQQQLEAQKLAANFATDGFNPYSTVQGGPLPDWAVRLNQRFGQCEVNDPTQANYGYFGGGSIAGPGGVQWPIVMPYFRDGQHVYMADAGGPSPNGGIEQLDGNDPGWTTIGTYVGLGQFGSISAKTKGATAILIGTGQELDTTSTDPRAVAVDPKGFPHVGLTPGELPSGPEDKPFWDLDSDSMMPKHMEGLPPGSMQPDNEYNQAALGAGSLLVQAGQAYTAAQNLDSHAKRQWYVAYQVNHDGRIRAVVHTYTAGAGDYGTVVDSFANGFPTGMQGYTSEIPYNTRVNPEPEHVPSSSSPAPTGKVHYTGTGEPLDNSVPIPEKLNK